MLITRSTQETPILSAQGDLGIQWFNYQDWELNPRSYETPASRSTVLTTVPNCRNSIIIINCLKVKDCFYRIFDDAKNYFHYEKNAKKELKNK